MTGAHTEAMEINGQDTMHTGPVTVRSGRIRMRDSQVMESISPARVVIVHCTEDLVLEIALETAMIALETWAHDQDRIFGEDQVLFNFFKLRQEINLTPISGGQGPPGGFVGRPRPDRPWSIPEPEDEDAEGAEE